MENLTDIKVIKDIFERHGFSFSKALGDRKSVGRERVC